MATFLSYLGGISKGASQNLLAQGAEKRARTERQNELQAQAIENAWKDPDFRADKTPEDFLNSMKQVHVLRGGSKAEADQIYGALSHVHNVHEKLGAPAGSLNDAFGPGAKAAAGGAPALPDMPSNSTTANETGTSGDQAAPAAATPATAPAQGLPAMPAAPAATANLAPDFPDFQAPVAEHADGSQLTYAERAQNKAAQLDYEKGKNSYLQKTGELAATRAASRKDIGDRVAALQKEVDPATGKSAWDLLSVREKALIRSGAD